MLSPAIRPQPYLVRTDSGVELERNRRAFVRYSERTGPHDASYDFPATPDIAGQSEEHQAGAEASALNSTPVAASDEDGRPGDYRSRNKAATAIWLYS